MCSALASASSAARERQLYGEYFEPFSDRVGKGISLDQHRRDVTMV